MGFDISWKLILIGLQSKKTEAWQLSRKEIIDYLITQLEGSENQTREKQVISLICIAEDAEAFGRKLQCLAEDEPSDVALQKRKWSAYLLKQILDANIQDPVQGLLELLFFLVQHWRQGALSTRFDGENTTRGVFYRFQLSKCAIPEPRLVTKRS